MNGNFFIEEKSTLHWSVDLYWKDIYEYLDILRILKYAYFVNNFS